MQYGITLPGRGPLSTPDSLATIAQRAEALGFDSIALGDHILVPRNIDSDYPYTETGEFPGSASGQAMEQITALAYMAGCTQQNPVGNLSAHSPASEPAGGGQGPGYAGRAIRRTAHRRRRRRLVPRGV